MCKIKQNILLNYERIIVLIEGLAKEFQVILHN